MAINHFSKKKLVLYTILMLKCSVYHDMVHGRQDRWFIKRYLVIHSNSHILLCTVTFVDEKYAIDIYIKVSIHFSIYWIIFDKIGI